MSIGSVIVDATFLDELNLELEDLETCWEEYEVDGIEEVVVVVKELNEVFPEGEGGLEVVS